MIRYLIGIDAGTSKATAWGMYDLQERKIINTFTGFHHDALNEVEYLRASRGNLGLVLEDTRLDPPFNFSGANDIKELAARLIGAKRVEALSLLRRNLGIARKLGMVDGLCSDWEQFARNQQLPLALIAPSRRTNLQENRKLGAEHSAYPSKMDARLFKKITGIKGGNSHLRDACLLVWKMTLPQFQMEVEKSK